jgi:hypothetical protein
MPSSVKQSQKPKSLTTAAAMASAMVTDPPAGSAALVTSTMPPVVTFPSPPDGFVPLNFANYRGSFPLLEQAAAAPDAAAEIEGSSTYATTFGSSVPKASVLAKELVTASDWTKLRVAAESFLLYVRSFEAITWKSARADLEKLDAVFQAVESHDPAALAAFPATKRLLSVPKVISARGAATRARDAKAKKAGQASAPTATNPTTTPVVTAATPPVANEAAAAPAVAASATGGGGTH